MRLCAILATIFGLTGTNETRRFQNIFLRGNAMNVVGCGSRVEAGMEACEIVRENFTVLSMNSTGGWLKCSKQV